MDSEVPQGRSSLKTLMGFISNHQEDPRAHTAASIASDHSLNTEAVQNVLTHFKVMHLHLPKDMYSETKNMSKIVAEQLKASNQVASGFKLDKVEGGDAQKSITGSPNTGESKS